MRSDNGPEFIAGKVTGWLKAQGSLTDAQVVVGGWVDDYNQSRQQRSLGKLTPTEFFERWSAEHGSAARLRCE